MHEPFKPLYAGIANVSYVGPQFDLGHGIALRSAFAHLFGPHMVAFAKAEPGLPHPAPWRAASGGFAFDIDVELSVTEGAELPSGFDPLGSVLLIAALLRLKRYPRLMVPILSDMPIDEAGTAKEDPRLRPFETEPRIFGAGRDAPGSLDVADLEWVKDNWRKAAALIRSSREFDRAFWAADRSGVAGRAASNLLLVWGAIEDLFAPSTRSELRFRVSANLAAFLFPPSADRLNLSKQIRKLYDKRSKAAHSAQNSEAEDLLNSYLLLRTCIAKIIETGSVPTPDILDQHLFCGNNASEMLVSALPSLSMHPGEFIREVLLPEYGLSVSEVARRIGADRATLSNVLHGKHDVSRDLAYKLGALLNDETADLLIAYQHAYDLERERDRREAYKQSIERVAPKG